MLQPLTAALGREKSMKTWAIFGWWLIFSSIPQVFSVDLLKKLNDKFLNREEGGVMKFEGETYTLGQKIHPISFSTFLYFPELTTPIQQVSETLPPDAEASTALIAGNKGSGPKPEGPLSSGAFSFQVARAPV